MYKISFETQKLQIEFLFIKNLTDNVRKRRDLTKCLQLYCKASIS